ncbi:2OG-Fe(II) oxygenase [Sphingobium sp. BYY-5]|uniref:2OG-Fe(II) oxygenase n=1 Tax=Sphingobium sp. BYY-5 TaxID=2926400 RepID=UPI001FA79D71|nr:2OG-Fe(II) oxygenase [Sphingobium sp. BYY-5]MCI4592304.1 2OG-Fe(II) oxygenase [Sphingobium sp. BYY-5]
MSNDVERGFALLDLGRQDEAIAIIRKSAERGDADALMTLAQWYLIGQPLPRDLKEARRFLHRAVREGNADAALMEVALTANGAGSRADWRAGLELLEAAAARYGGVAAQHLALLLRMNIDEEGNPREAIEPEKLGREFHVHRWRQFLTAEECAHIAMAAQDLLEPSIVADPRTGRAIPHPIRTSSAAVIGPSRETLPIQAILRRIAAVTGTKVEQGEPLNLLHYAPGQEYREHMDVLPMEQNQRVVTAIIYLNSGYVGGETRFTQQGLSIAGSGGDMIAFSNSLPDGSPDIRSRHLGTVVHQGAKWAATRWIRRTEFDVWKQNR